MPAIFNALPGIEVPVGSISKSLASMWSQDELSSSPTPTSDDVKATQVNFVLHLGYNTTSDDAATQFRTAVRFSKRYPCRVVVLCPQNDSESTNEVRAKVYGECHLGKTKGDMRCCEFVMLSYPRSARKYLESQVSVCLSTDLPLYYWAHRFSSTTLLSDYQYLLRNAKRVLIDSALVPEDALHFAWPRPEAVRDLVQARLLPVRQSIGHFLGGIAPATLADGLVKVVTEHGKNLRAEARVLGEWAKGRLIDCGAPSGLECQCSGNGALSDDCVKLTFEYSNRPAFVWNGDFAKGCARVTADFGKAVDVNGATSLLAPEASLAESMFF